ncbi:hypothetical protein [uncultured Azohydromonas sp.]|uniref:hypothetical protein n=1 Tax=uncultured Azohydromonas sp. TaxID=487342 RepID=UPI002620048E|nr:hypothetical protein [uncultured Azohydromonas sp.]
MKIPDFENELISARQSEAKSFTKLTSKQPADFRLAQVKHDAIARDSHAWKFEGPATWSSSYAGMPLAACSIDPGPQRLVATGLLSVSCRGMFVFLLIKRNFRVVVMVEDRLRCGQVVYPLTYQLLAARTRLWAQVPQA